MQRAPRRRARGPDRQTVIKDGVSFTLAWALIWFLALYGANGPIAWGLLGLAGTLLGVPLAGRSRSRESESIGIDGSDSSSLSQDSSPS